MKISMWFKGIRGRLLFSTVLPLLAVGFMTWIGFSISDSLGKRLDAAYETTIPNMDALSAAMEARVSMGYRIWMVLGVDLKDTEFRNKNIEGLEGHLKEFKAALQRYESAPFSPGESELYAPFKSQLDKYVAINEEIIKDLKTETAEGNARAMKYMRGGEWQTIGAVARKSFDQITDFYAEMGKKDNAAQKQQRADARFWTGTVGAGSCILLMVVLMWIAQRLASSVSHISSKISEAGAQVTAAIEQLSAAGQALSQSSTEAAASLEETVASLEEMTSMVNLNSDNAKQAATLSIASRESAERGQSEIHVLVTSMSEISQSSRKIEEIINVIDDIAFQTNLLALNAAVEAARAGEQGKGFAVVADAVRTLAQRSADAAKDITGLIKDSVDKIDRGTKVADKSGAVMSDIVVSVKKVSDLSAEISSGSSEQSTGISQISKAMNQLDSSSQSNAASSEEIASTAEEISAQATQMQRMMEDLSFLISGERAVPMAISVSESAKRIHRVAPVPSKTKAQSSAEFLPLTDEEEGGRGHVGKVSGF
ncbi:methyl-accepting chemotaxis protein [Bdellovibrio sp. SKB1291214]|uniref:HAMP domain-containing methyl-accepting chemotaxis protein n=1 Tax=Bdellovibrio sp. SKB1291214 TaxID=1732569 RepID=UPI000B6B32AD|nr:methyl-accepting chemotaxis protein [Bdellovibrio sp. SKB1291214]UYL09319.1 methyl-accepting chemotaxis protein [Bdellovibrio sp. SKB1291214]